MRSPRDVHGAIDKGEPRPLVLRSGIEGNGTAAIADAWIGCRDCYGRARYFVSGNEVDGVKPLVKCRSRGNHRFGDDVKNICVGVNDRRSCYSNFWRNIRLARSHQISGFARRHGSLPRRASVSAIDEAGLPQLETRIQIGVEGVQAIMLRGDENDVMFHATDGKICNP